MYQGDIIIRAQHELALPRPKKFAVWLPASLKPTSRNIFELGYFEACANPVRTAADGRSVIVPFRWFGPVCLLRDDADVVRVKRGFKWLQISTFAAIVVTSGIFGLRIIIPLLVGQCLWLYLLTRRLVATDLTPADLPRMPRGEAVARTHATMGKPLVWATRALTPVVSVLFFWGAWKFGGAIAWIGTPLIILLNGMLVYDFLQLRAYRKSATTPSAA